jgi:hypothetical protein
MKQTRNLLSQYYKECNLTVISMEIESFLRRIKSHSYKVSQSPNASEHLYPLVIQF